MPSFGTRTASGLPRASTTSVSLGGCDRLKVASLFSGARRGVKLPSADAAADCYLKVPRRKRPRLQTEKLSKPYMGAPCVRVRQAARRRHVDATKAALLILMERWPSAVQVQELVATALEGRRPFLRQLSGRGRRGLVGDLFGCLMREFLRAPAVGGLCGARPPVVERRTRDDIFDSLLMRFASGGLTLQNGEQPITDVATRARLSRLATSVR